MDWIILESSNPCIVSSSCSVSQFQEKDAQGGTENSRPARKRRRGDPVADLSSLEPRPARVRRKPNLIPVVDDPPKVKAKVKAQVQFFTFLVDTSPIS